MSERGAGALVLGSVGIAAVGGAAWYLTKGPKSTVVSGTGPQITSGGYSVVETQNTQYPAKYAQPSYGQHVLGQVTINGSGGPFGVRAWIGYAALESDLQTSADKSVFLSPGGSGLSQGLIVEGHLFDLTQVTSVAQLKAGEPGDLVHAAQSLPDHVSMISGPIEMPGNLSVLWAAGPLSVIGGLPPAGGQLPTTQGVTYRLDKHVILMPGSPNRSGVSSTTVRCGATYTIKSGDTLASIALAVYGSSSMWVGIWSANKAKIPNPNLIYPGETLCLPPAPTGISFHTPSSVGSKPTSWPAEITWAPGPTGSGDITGTWTPVSGAINYQVLHVTPTGDYLIKQVSGTSITLTGGHSNYVVTLAVRACNQYGCGPSSPGSSIIYP